MLVLINQMNIEDTRNTISRIWVSVQSIRYNIHNRKKKKPTHLFLSPLTLAPGTSKRQFGQK